MTEALLVPVGSAGDVLPFLAIGRELKRRGKRVGVLVNEYFEEPVRRAGLDFVPYGSRDEYLAVLHAATRPRELLRATRKLAQDTTRRLHDAVREHSSAQTTVVAHTLAFGARIAAEKRGLRALTAHLAPAALDRDPVLPGFFNSDRRPSWYRRGVRWVFDRIADAVWGGPVNELRRELGLPKERPSRTGSLESALGLFPDWFAPPQPEWPADTVLTGFMLYDDPGAADLSGVPEKPIVFTPGSGKVDERRFFEVAIEASRRLGRPALLLTRFREQLPAQLPPHARHEPFVPLGALLPRAAAIVHHGGIGTCAQALASGTPQLVMPTGFDQLDNAARLRRLGAGAALSRRQFRPDAVERALRELLESSEVAANCRAAAARMATSDAAARACDAIERA